MNRYALVMIGGAVGSLLRFIAATFVSERYAGRFPAGTFSINVGGSFAIGLLMAVLTARGAHPNWRYLLVTGFLGGFTTFSSFEYELYMETQLGHNGIAAVYAVASVAAGFAAVIFGAFIGSRL